ncbi:gamma-glutamyl-phosphate reductase [Oscillatoria sp. CS-180]|uniref:gamma-glutamyl-phosphate reductase n=1 Tax=Oscillatoria sp. CS-180 TaxID=3021720 RepID=UPI00232B494C|nr:gamma-glutamyl-phosphate reductase [Oscillatoria sp. CS-180]MDB9526894.1 gamma-glutamyl-phosphate reductase [Oscillatoria sp. CS-180]
MTSVQSLAELSALIRQVRYAAKALEKVEKVTEVLHLATQTFREETDAILEANTLDLEASLEMAVPELVVEWLKLTPERLNTAITILERLANLDSVTSSVYSSQLAIASISHSYLLGEPLGVIAFVYEALPELAIVAAGLCLRAGNGLILKGGHEASQTNQVIAEVFQTVLARVSLPEAAILTISPSEGEAARRWLMQTTELDLLIPYGRASLVQQVVREANSPSLSIAIANCYLYWAHTAPADVVAEIVLDSRRGNPEPVNGIEKILVDNRVSPIAMDELFQLLQERGLKPIDVEVPSIVPFIAPEEEELWQEAQLNYSVVVSRVTDLSTAIALINRYSNGHADCIVTNSYQESVQFASQVRSASIYVNASPRFKRNAAQANAIALGMSAQRGLKGGRITLESLLTHKAVIQGLVQ